MGKNKVPKWSYVLCVATSLMVMVDICYSQTDILGKGLLLDGIDPNILVKSASTNFAEVYCAECAAKEGYSLGLNESEEQVKKEKKEITKIGCTKKFLEQSGLEYKSYKDELLKKCVEDNQEIEFFGEIETTYEKKRRYVYGCKFELTCYQEKKGGWSGSPMRISFLPNVKIKGPLKP